MQRPIKFRAWCDVHGMGGVHRLQWENGVAVSADVLVSEGTKSEYRGLGDDILMQYTGLKDKNGKEIYEGDITKWHYGGNWEVVWLDGHSSIGEMDDEWGEMIGFAIRSKEINEVTGYPKLEQLTSDRIYEVIGNIYENPELLEQS